MKLPSVKKIKYFFFFCSLKMSGKTSKFDDVEVNKKEFHTSKQPIEKSSVDINRIVISKKYKRSDKVVIISLAMQMMLLLDLYALCCLK